jgi:hypothetical protein
MEVIKLGKQQKELLERMARENLVIQSVFDYYRCTEDIYLSDENRDNIYENIPRKVLQGLVDRDILISSSVYAALKIELITFRIRKQDKQYFLNGNIAKPSNFIIMNTYKVTFKFNLKDKVKTLTGNFGIITSRSFDPDAIPVKANQYYVNTGNTHTSAWVYEEDLVLMNPEIAPANKTT